jgi:hypothetical protein
VRKDMTIETLRKRLRFLEETHGWLHAQQQQQPHDSTSEGDGERRAAPASVGPVAAHEETAAQPPPSQSRSVSIISPHSVNNIRDEPLDDTLHAADPAASHSRVSGHDSPHSKRHSSVTGE